ncbi:hypothetical protein, partial [Phyllobacterium calauticae]
QAHNLKVTGSNPVPATNKHTNPASPKTQTQPRQKRGVRRLRRREHTSARSPCAAINSSAYNTPKSLKRLFRSTRIIIVPVCCGAILAMSSCMLAAKGIFDR